MLNGVGMGDANMKRVQLIKRLMNKGYNLQVMAINGLKMYLIQQRDKYSKMYHLIDAAKAKKSQLLKRLMNNGYNLQVMAINGLKEFLS